MSQEDRAMGAMNVKVVAYVGGTVLLAVASAAALKLYDVPTKVAVLESKQENTDKRQDGFESAVKEINTKLDDIRERLPRRK